MHIHNSLRTLEYILSLVAVLAYEFYSYVVCV